MGDDKTHVEVAVHARNRLRAWKAQHGLTYSEAIHALLDEFQARDDRAVELFMSCPECGYDPDDEEGVWRTMGEGEYVKMHYIDCPNCDARWPMAAQRKPGINADMPDREEILEAIGYDV